MIEYFVHKHKDDTITPIQYSLPDGTIIKADKDGTINFLPLSDSIGELIKIIYLENPDITQTEEGESLVIVGTITNVTKERITYDLD